MAVGDFMKASSKKTKRVSHPSKPTKTKILVIDDDSAVAEMLRNYLGGKRCFVVLSASTGGEGIQQAIEQMPDLILINTRLSDMNGLDVHEHLKQNSGTRAIPVIYISSFSSLRIIEQATKQGAKGFFMKPFTLSNIYTKMASVLQMSQPVH
ncbi:MAG: response regulator [Candidatus Abyssobacteria bacterium SURF_5]|uniref:Response regulator n=1 Tax=Abyssobacteria bacterium (strain SURF_5) TaxID=2093360 RepID=A0A3A4N992_ABYX5|nr:MAG: response regulator [Candidatus Abyssubacteria bacterium SURF_5]